jgi:menaquinone-9 beta-reductase
MTSSSTFDLIMVGGGPAGSAAAITAARGGARVLLLERGRLPRHKVCGEFVSAESLELLGSLLHGQHLAVLNDAVRISRSRLYVDGRVIGAVVDPAAASIARFDLDAALWESAQLAGVDARQQVTVREIEGRGPFRISSSGGEFESRAVINASGRWSNLNGAAGASQQKWVGLKAHFAEPSHEVSVDLYFFDGGYCGVQPVGSGRVNTCAMVRADVASTLDDVFEQHEALRKRSRGWKLLTDPVSTSPLIFREPQPERDGILQAGDAAGFIDPFAGDGISLALRSGAMAANCLMPFFAGKTSLGSAIQEYRCAYERSLVPIFRASSQLRRFLTLPRPARRPLLLVLEKSPRIAEYLVRRTR